MNSRKHIKTGAGSRVVIKHSTLAALVVVVTGCTNFSLPVIGTDPGNAAQPPVSSRPPAPDSRGVITFPNYQAVRSRQGETLTDIAARLEIDVDALSLRNGLDADTPLREGELLLLPSRVPEEGEGLAALVSSALQNAAPLPQAQEPLAPPTPARSPDAPEPVRHVVERGETAYSVARLYNVSVRALADWNGLPADYAVREGQALMIPLAEATGSEVAGLDPSVTPPGTGTPVPNPPSARAPLPEDPVPAAPQETPPATPLNAPATAASDTGDLAKPVAGTILRPYEKGVNDGVDFGVSAGSPVVAALGGTVVAITRDVDQVPIIVIRHPDNMLTVYANVDAISVAKDETVSRGQQIAVVPQGDPSFLHFEVRVGFDSVDPVNFF